MGLFQSTRRIFYSLQMNDKIKGEFLRIEEEGGGHYRVHYVGQNGKPSWVRVDTDNMGYWAEECKRKVEELRTQITQTTDERKLEKLRSELGMWHIMAVWPDMWIAHCNGEDLRKFFEPSVPLFGIPITKGRLLSKGEHGAAILFNLRHLHLRQLLRAQLFSANRQALTETVVPHIRVTDIFNFPLSASSPLFAFAQKEYTAIVFLKFPNFAFSDSTRIVFWFGRYPIPVKSGNDYLDLPDEAVPLAQAHLEKEILLRLNKPIPERIEETIKKETARITSEGNIQNYYLSDTFSLSEEEMNKLAGEDVEPRNDQADHDEDGQLNNLKKFHHGQLKKRLEQFLERDGCKQYETVPSTKIAKWAREIKSEGYQTNENTIRAKLSDMGFTTERS